jgi:hypothetical protein
MARGELLCQVGRRHATRAKQNDQMKQKIARLLDQALLLLLFSFTALFAFRIANMMRSERGDDDLGRFLAHLLGHAFHSLGKESRSVANFRIGAGARRDDPLESAEVEPSDPATSPPTSTSKQLAAPV